MIGNKYFSAEAWFDAAQWGRTFVTNRPILEVWVDGLSLATYSL
jgi:hypothetical protein